MRPSPVWFGCLFLSLSACKTNKDLSQEELFDPNRVIEVEIEMDEADAEALAIQTRNLLDTLSGECTAQPFGSPFSFFPAEITIDGAIRRKEIGIRKKGFLGSLNTEKPSLKIDLEEFVNDNDQEIAELEKLTFNNANQDPSLVRTCITYQLFTAAGLPAPRCNFAHVTVNGEDAGIYVQIESINKDFVKAHFSDDSGNLYEGTLSDLRPEFLGTFEKETNKDDPSFADLEALATALTVDDTQLIAALDPIVDLEQFFTFWAMEVLTNHWDGYTNNTNNFYMYNDPSIGKFVFIVSGPDGALLDSNPFPAGPNPPISVFASGLLAHRLYLHPEGQARFLTRLNELLVSVWDEAALGAELDRMEALLAPFGVVDSVNLSQVRTFIANQRSAIQTELALGAPAWPFPLKDLPCLSVTGQLDGTFSTEFGTLDDPNIFATGPGTLNVTEGATPLDLTSVASAAGFDPNTPGVPQVRLLGVRADGNAEVAIINFPEGFSTGTARFDLLAPAPLGVVGVFDNATQQFNLTGFIAGEVEVTRASEQEGSPVEGSFSGEIVLFPGF